MTTGVSSRASASAKTPPTDLVKPSFANSRTNWWHSTDELAIRRCYTTRRQRVATGSANLTRRVIMVLQGWQWKDTKHSEQVPVSCRRGKAGKCSVSTWMVKTMPTKAAVRSATPRERGPTSDSCSLVLRQWILPARMHADAKSKRASHHVAEVHQDKLCVVGMQSSASPTLQHARQDLAAQHEGRYGAPQPLGRLAVVQPRQAACRHPITVIGMCRDVQEKLQAS